jgi:hypothetical protein
MEEVAKRQTNEKEKNLEKSSGMRKVKETIKRKKGKEMKRRSLNRDLSEILQKEMQNINKNLNKMETKFVKKIEILEKKQKKIGNASNKIRRSVKKKSKPKGKIGMINNDTIDKKVFLMNPMEMNIEKSALTSRMLTPMSENPMYLEEKIMKKIMLKVENIIDKRVSEQCFLEQERYQENILKMSKNLEK